MLLLGFLLDPKIIVSCFFSIYGSIAIAGGCPRKQKPRSSRACRVFLKEGPRSQHLYRKGTDEMWCWQKTAGCPWGTLVRVLSLPHQPWHWVWAALRGLALKVALCSCSNLLREGSDSCGLLFASTPMAGATLKGRVGNFPVPTTGPDQGLKSPAWRDSTCKEFRLYAMARRHKPW